MKSLVKLCVLTACFIATASHAADKTFIDYSLPMPIEGSLVSDVWGAPGVFPRDCKNGLEDETMKQWNYWDGQIIKGPEGKYHMFASRWDQARGHRGWGGSLAVHAVSDNVTGPYVDKGLCWPDNQGGKGHNVTALVLPDGRYVVVVSETRPGDVFVSDSLDGPWEHLGSIKVAENEFSRLGRLSREVQMIWSSSTSQQPSGIAFFEAPLKLSSDSPLKSSLKPCLASFCESVLGGTDRRPFLVFCAVASAIDIIINMARRVAVMHTRNRFFSICSTPSRS